MNNSAFKIVYKDISIPAHTFKDAIRTATITIREKKLRLSDVRIFTLNTGTGKYEIR